MLTALSKAERPRDRLTALRKVEGLRYASSFVIAAYCKYASFLKIRKPCIWSFLLCRLSFDFLRVYQYLQMYSYLFCDTPFPMEETLGCY
jgi:hypothetical protein